MRHFSIPLELEASIYIQARTLSEAQPKLDALLTKSIDAGDMHWFTNGPFGSSYLPELAFGTELRVRHMQPDEPLQEVESHDLWHLVRSREEHAKRCVLPTSRDWYGEGKLPIYGADVLLRTACYIKAESMEAAQVFVAHLKDKRLNRYEDDQIFWDYALLGPSQIVLSPNMLVAEVLDPGRDQEQLRLISTGDPAAVLSQVPDGSSAEDNEVHSVAAHLRGLLRYMDGGFETMADQHAHEIASLLIEYRNKTVGKPTRDEWDW